MTVKRTKLPAQGDMLISHISPRQSYLRAANLELHHDQVEHYIPTGRALEVVRRLVHSVSNPAGGRAWSLTGPYGSGKSSFALFLHTLLGPECNRRQHAEVALRNADQALLESLREARTILGAECSGFILATTTCQQEPLTESLLRALTQGVKGRWPTRMPAKVATALTLGSKDKSARSIAAAVKEVSAHAPVLMILDEFGKTLEHFANSAASGSEGASDLFVLQELAELASGRDAAPAFTFTLQHLAFDDYVRQASAAQRREWGKVQGRFEDVPFLESAEQSLRLVAGALNDSEMAVGFRRRRKVWSERAYGQASAIGAANHLPGGAETLAQCYPMHPTALLALPELCALLGQHGRTLFTFLASTEPNTARDFLGRTAVPAAKAVLPVMTIADLFDFFSGPGQALAAGVGGNKWREIHERVREASNLPLHELQALKTVGLLNLMGNVVGLRASAEIVTYALSAPDQPLDTEWKVTLGELEARGWLTYRSFADEYRLWQGSDVDLRGRVADAREQLRSTSAAELLKGLQAESPLIAGKHSQRVGMLRYFTVGYCDDDTTDLARLDDRDPADGALIYHLGSPDSAELLRTGVPGRPILLATSDDAGRVRDAAVEAAAALAVLDQQEVADDRVARRELQDRVADARSRLSQAFADAFQPTSGRVQFRLVTGSGLGEPLDSSWGLSRLLSDVCDAAYDESPEIRNEMLGRRELTSQGAKARRNLIEAMVAYRSLEQLGFGHYKPERAMYEAVLRFTGLHGQAKSGEWTFGPPMPLRKLTNVWGAMTQFVNATSDEPASVDKLYERLMAPPIGLKEGPIPVFLTAFLLFRDDDIAIYEDGSYQPSLSIEVLERLMKTPHRFALKAFSTAGSRGRVLAAVRDATRDLSGHDSVKLSATALRNSTVLALAAPLLRFVRTLPEYTLQTTSLSARTLAVRAALMEAREPDILLLEWLPQACDLGALTRARIADADLKTFVRRLRAALKELEQAYSAQLVAVGDLLALELERPPQLDTLRAALRHRAETLEGKVLDPKLRAFLFNASDDGPADENWLAAIGLAVSDRPVELWRDDDREKFAINLRHVVASFRRVEALHFDAAAKSDTDGFTARRLAQTTPEGIESSRVVYFSDEMSEPLRMIADEAFAKAIEAVGPQGRDALAALLVDQIFQTSASEQFDSDSQGPIAVSNRKASHGTRRR
jgi:hypothetical protein